MKERGIIFSGDSVRAILEGRKTQTRRVVKSDKPEIAGPLPNGHFIAHRFIGDMDGDWIKCPFGKPGDRLWVRETHALDPPQNGSWDYYGYTDGVLENISVIPERFRNPEHVIYRASWDGGDLRWRPSIFMPRWASRITLEVVNVRVERLQSISAEDIIAEGFSSRLREHDAVCDLQEQIETAWDKINGKKHPWASNPWVWAVEFKVIK